MKAENQKPIYAADLIAMLAEKYKAPEYAFLREVGSGTGANSGRYADAIAMSLWPSRGLHLIGFEIKVSRADWLKEKETPAKAEAIAKYCDFWYLVVSAKEIVQNGELPPTWGLIAPRGDKLVIVKEAEKLSPQPMDRKFLAALLRRASEVDRRPFEIELRRARDAAFTQGKQSAETGLKAELKNTQEYYDLLKNSVREFEEKSGIKIDCWNGGKIGDTIHRAMNTQADFERTLGMIRNLKQSSLIISSAVDALERNETDARAALKELAAKSKNGVTYETN